MEDKNSMLYWWPKIVHLDIPKPETIVVEVKQEDVWAYVDEGKDFPQFPLFCKAVKTLGLPVFIRTDQMSGKHSWLDTCFLNSPDSRELQRHIGALTEETLSCDMIGRPVSAFVFRKYIAMASLYTAFFREMPVSPERRYFVEDGKVLCHHPYWIKEAIIHPSVRNWRALSDKMNQELPEEIDRLTKYATMVSTAVSGFWSVDFCKAWDGTWYLIDMALGESSWHPKDCSNNRTIEVDYMKLAMEKFKSK